MSDDAKRVEALVKRLINKLGLEVSEQPCLRCNGTGRWQDGGDCAECDGATVIYSIKGHVCDGGEQ